ncbi:MAG: hypothetical protein SGCHY_004714, partial [Lobulomycetales sp.]
MEAFLEEERRIKAIRVRELFDGLALFEKSSSDTEETNQYEELYRPPGRCSSKSKRNAADNKLALKSQSISKFMPNVVHTPLFAGTPQQIVSHTPPAQLPSPARDYDHGGYFSLPRNRCNERGTPQQIVSYTPPVQLPSPARDDDHGGYFSLPRNGRNRRATVAEIATGEDARYLSLPRKEGHVAGKPETDGQAEISGKKRVHFPEDMKL